MPSQILKDDLLFGEELGVGSMSRVLLAEHAHTKIKYALKVISKKEVVSKKQIELVMLEKDLLSRLKHPNIISLVSTFQTDMELFFVLEHCDGGEVLEHIKLLGNLSASTTKYLLAELLNALCYLHAERIVHRDLKPENLLLCNGEYGYHLKLIDFATSAEFSEKPQKLPAIERRADDDLEDLDEEAEERLKLRRESRHQSNKLFVGTAQYCAPEMLVDCSSTFSSDLWAFGVLLYHMLVGASPFDDEMGFMVFKKILARQFDFPDNFDAAARDLCDQLIVLHPCDRLGVGNDGACQTDILKKHPFFEGVEWEKLPYQKLDLLLGDLPPQSTD